MADFAGTMKEAAFATSPREFDLSYSTTLEEIFDKLNARRTAFQMPFQIKGGVAGQRIVFEKEPNLDVTLWLYLSNGTHIRIQPVISEAKASVGGVRVDKNSALRKGVKGATIGLATDRGGYIDAVTTITRSIRRWVRRSKALSPRRGSVSATRPRRPPRPKWRSPAPSAERQPCRMPTAAANTAAAR